MAAKMSKALQRLAQNTPYDTVIQYRGKRYLVNRCHGEAHKNPYIDNCMTCAPLWGKCLEPLEPGEGVIVDARAAEVVTWLVDNCTTLDRLSESEVEQVVKDLFSTYIIKERVK